MWFWALVLRLIFLFVPFDIYFTSPLVRDGVEIRDPPPGIPPTTPARRLVLFVADGFRARSYLNTDRAPNLKSIARNRGSWGISNTRIPTESRPGHVAMIAGFYEDPSAIAKGWKENPIEFDSLFNRSRRTWSWGSPTILPMFAKGIPGKKNTARLDSWVFRKVENFFEEAKTNRTLADLLREDKLVFFLHLLGLDTAGHTHKPDSRKYNNNIKTVDDGIIKIEKIIEDYFGDEKTAYVFTADHGMTDWGSHGAGSDDETLTPFIAWGAGIISNNENSKTQNDSTLKLPDIEQADICPLMSILIGVDIPADSVGLIPESYLNMTERDKALSLNTNMMQILKQYNKKRESIERNAIKILFKPFDELTEKKLWQKCSVIKNLIIKNKFTEAKNACKEIIQLALTGLDYYQNYYQTSLLNSMTISYFGWIFWLISILLEGSQKIQNNDTLTNRKSNGRGLFTKFIFGLILVSVVFLCFLQNFPLQYYVYFTLPVLLWWRVSTYLSIWSIFIKTIREKFNSTNNTFINPTTYAAMKLFSLVTLYIAGIIILVMAFFQRWTLSIGLFGLAIFPLKNSYRQHLPIYLLVSWFFSCVLLAGFSFLPVIGKQDDIHLVGVSGLLWFLLSVGFLFKFSLPMLKSGKETKKENLIMVLPPTLMLVAIQNKYFVAFKFQKEEGLPLVCQIISWALAIMCFIVPLFSSKWIISRLYCIISSLAIYFLLLSVSHESFFLLTLTINLFCWLAIENNTSRMNKSMKLTNYSFGDSAKIINVNKIMAVDRILNSDDFRRSYIFLLYIILSFFGTGNIASLNSFDPQWIRCFVAQFSPFTMAALLVSKTLIPFLCVACSFCAVNLIVKAPTGHLFLIVIIFSDLMGLIFLHLVTNKGSWLDIGTSISHYIIMETTVFFVSILYAVGQFMTGLSMWSSKIFATSERPKKY